MPEGRCRIGSDTPEIYTFIMTDLVILFKTVLNTTMFWKPRQHNSKTGELEKVSIDYGAYYQFLGEIGIYSLNLGGSRRQLVKVVGSVVQKITLVNVVEEVKGYLLELNTVHKVDPSVLELVGEEYASKLPSLHKRERLPMIPLIQKPFLRDTVDESFVCYSNCLVKVTRSGINVIQYDSLDDRLVWRSQIVDREFRHEMLDTNSNSMFVQFCQNVSGDDESFEALRRIFGYLLHGYSNPTNPRAVIFHDKLMDGNPNGGTGKGLLVQGVRHIRQSMVSIDGKQFKPDRFPFSQVQPDTQVASIDDIQPQFDFEFLFSALSEGLSVEQKGKDVWKCDAEYSPKLILTTNTPLTGQGSSHARRKVEFGLTHHYNDRFTPMDEFRCRFFYDFSQRQWSEFDAFMLNCLRDFLSSGLSLGAASKVSKLTAAIPCPEFVEFASSFFETDHLYRLPIARGKFQALHPKALEYDDPRAKKRTKLTDRQKALRFREWVVRYGEVMGFHVNHVAKKNFVRFYERGNSDSVSSFLETTTGIYVSLEAANQAYRKATNLWCSDDEFEKYQGIALRFVA
jgi:hypothetical protein